MEHPTPAPPPGGTIGVDIVHVPRIAEQMENPRFLQRVFTPLEQEQAGSGPLRAARLAARWAAKEALAKALGCGIGPHFAFLDGEVVREGEGPPALRLRPEAAARHGDPSIRLSIAHDGDYAIATVLLLPKADLPGTEAP
jgi:holo-[acyl-carrier protein] synthase